MSNIARRPDGKWRVRYRDTAGREHSKHFDRKIDADRWVVGQQAGVDRGEWIDPRRGRVKVRDYCEQWRAAQPHRPGTVRLYERTLRLHVYPRLGDRPLSTVQRSDVQALTTAAAGNLAPYTVQTVVQLLRAVFGSAVEDGLIVRSPVRRIAREAVQRPELSPLTVEQVLGLAEVVPARYRALVLLAAGAGLRQGECLGLVTRRIDFLRREVDVAEQLVAVPGTPTGLGLLKTAASTRRVPLPDVVLEAPSEHLGAFPRGPWDLVFASSAAGPVSRASFHVSWVKSLAAAGLPAGTRFHDLRHGYASTLIEGGESVTVVAKRLGHANPTETLRTYAHLFPDSDARTRTVVDGAFRKAAADSLRTAGVPVGG